MTKSRGINRPKFCWTRDTDDLLRELYPDFPTKLLAERFGCTEGSMYRRASALGLKKSAAYLASPYACRLRRGDQVGNASRFPKGHTPANKGLRRPGWAPGRMASTQFKPGERQGVAVKLYQPIGTERISKDGYLERKINDDMPLQRRWRAVHIVMWEEAHGPLPAGHCLSFIDHDKTHIALDNLELITRAERMRRNSYHTNYPKEVAQLIQLKGALVRKINHWSNA